MNILADRSEMRTRIRSFDWSRTPLGPVDSWPQSLKTSVDLILGSRHPMWVGWGREMTFLYNDAYLHVLGAAKHPSALGKPAAEVWAEVWDVCGPLAEKVFERAEASFVDDVRLFMDRGDRLEETFYSFSYSPIRDELGRACGLFCPSTDVTPKVINARRLATLSELSANALVEKTIRRACAVAAHTLSKNPDDIPFALLYLAEGDAVRLRLEQEVGDWAAGAPPVRELDLRSEAADSPVGIAFSSGQRMTADVENSFVVNYEKIGQRVRQAVALPVASPGDHRPYGVLLAGVNPCRPLDSEHLTFFELVAGQFATAIQNARAVEEEKRRADMLAEIDRAKTVFFSNVSHEFRTPLTLMLGPIESLLAKPGSLKPEDYDDLVIAHRNSLRLLKLVNSLLDFSRIEAGRMTASFVATDLAALTADLASGFRSAMESAGLRYAVNCEPLPEAVYVDREMWEKIVLNLLSNAFKFTFEGEVSVRLKADGGSAVLAIADTGTGIPEAELPRVFERFHRVENARGRTHEGAGIGLALIHELAKLHDGRVSVESHVGQGSIFRVAIPMGAAHIPKERIAAPSETQTTTRLEAFTGESQTWVSRPRADSRMRGARPRIVLADDNADMREYVARVLGEEYEIAMSTDGGDALDLVRSHPPDLVLTDVMMPGTDGMQLLRALRASPATSTLPVIFLSARAGDEMRIEGLEMGADDYLVKPFTANELRARVGAHIRLARARRAATEREAALRAEAEAARDEVVAVLESIKDAFMAVDSEWRFTYFNAEAERVSGLPRAEVLGRNHWEVYPQSPDAVAYRELHRAAHERAAVEFEDFHEPWRRWFDVKAYPRSDGGLSIFYEDITARKVAERDRALLLERERAAREEAEILNEVSRSLSGELESNKLLRMITDAGARLTGAEFAAFFCNSRSDAGERLLLYALSGAPVETFEGLGLERNARLFSLTFRGAAVVRSGDILRDPRYGDAATHFGLPAGRVPVRSYLAIPVVSRSGEVHGGLVFGHPEPDVFTERAERIASGIAAHAAIAIDNARLFEKAENEILQRKDAEERLVESERRFREVIDTLPAAIYTTDAEGWVTHYNPAAVRLSGRRPEIGKDRWTILEKVLLPDGQKLSPEETFLARALREGVGQPGAELIAERPDGRRVWFTPFPTPMRDDRGRITGAVDMLLDITGRKDAEEALRASEARFRELADSMPQMVWSARADGVVDYRNQRWFEFTGLGAEKIVESGWEFLLHPEDREAFDKSWEASIRTGEPFRLEHRIWDRKEHRYRWFIARSLPVFDGQGLIQRWFGTATDIDEQKRVEEELRRANQDLEQFAYSASHDLREPLRSLTVYSELLATRYQHRLDEQGLEFCTHLGHGARQMEMLVRDLLEYTQISRLDVGAEECDAAEALNEVLGNLSEAIAESGAQVSVEPLPRLPINSTQLKQLFQNLIGNAIKYRSPAREPRVEVRAERRGGHWLVSVADNGIGIEPEYKERIFGLFKRLHSGHEYSGTGIGLAICQRIVDRHHGRIWVESEPGRGSTFRFTIPL